MNSRRNFYKNNSSNSCIAFLSKQTFAEKKLYDGPMLRVTIIGLGSYGTRVAEAMQDCKMAKLVGVVSGTPSKLLHGKTKYNIPAENCYNYENFDNIKNNPNIDAVYVITPNGLHKEQK